MWDQFVAQANDMLPKPSKKAASNIIRWVIPECEWLLRRMKSAGGWLKFDCKLCQRLEALKISDYAKWYAQESAFPYLIARCFLSDEDTRQFLRKINGLNSDAMTAFLDGVIADIQSAEFNKIVLIPRTDREKERTRKLWETLTDDERGEATVHGQYIWTVLLVLFHDLLSVMIHGQRLVKLVQRAMAGDDSAFVKAVQVDRNILTHIPFFVSRTQRAQFECDWQFLSRLGYRVGGSTGTGKIRQPVLYFVFALLDGMNLLNGEFSHEEIRELANTNARDADSNYISDVGIVTKRLREYRRNQLVGSMSMP